MSLRKIDLRLFDEGAVAGETSSDAGESSTAEGSSAEVSTTSEMSFDDFVEAHKDEYNKRVEGIVRQRIKDAKATKDNLTKAYSALDILAPKYKLEAGNYEGIINPIRSDKSILEE